MILGLAQMGTSANSFLGSSGLGQVLIAVLCAYLIGGFNTSYYLVRWRTGADIRGLGTGTAGATNAGRILGRSGFLAVFVIDFLKGSLAVIGADLGLGPVPWMLGLVALAVTVGHIWPLQLGFRGGKGVATSLGALLVYEIQALGILAGISLIAFAISRRYTLGGLLGYVLCPLAMLLFGLPASSVVCVGALSLVVGIAHRSDLGFEFRRLGIGKSKPHVDRVTSSKLPP